MSRERESQRISVLIFYGTLLLLGWLAYRIVEPFLVPIGWAVVLAICLDPARARLRRRLGDTRTALLLTVLVVVVLVLPLLYAGSALLNEGQQAVSDVRDRLEDKGGAVAWLHRGWDWARHRLAFLPPEEEVIAKITASMGAVAGFMASRAGRLLAGALAFIVNLLITLAILFFLLRDAGTFASGLKRVLPFEPEESERFGKLSRDLVSASVTASLASATVQGFIGGLAFWILGLHAPVFWGFVMAVFAFLPVLGATLVWLPAAVELALTGSFARGIALFLVGILILSTVDNVIRSLLLSGKARMNTLVMLLSVLGGVNAFGFIGVVLGPLVAAVLTALFEGYTQPPDIPTGPKAAIPVPDRGRV